VNEQHYYTGAQILASIEPRSFEIDSKAMRKIQSNESILIVVSVTAAAATLAFDMAVGARVLVALP